MAGVRFRRIGPAGGFCASDERSGYTRADFVRRRQASAVGTLRQRTDFLVQDTSHVGEVCAWRRAASRQTRFIVRGQEGFVGLHGRSGWTSGSGAPGRSPRHRKPDQCSAALVRGPEKRIAKIGARTVDWQYGSCAGPEVGFWEVIAICSAVVGQTGNNPKETRVATLLPPQDLAVSGGSGGA